VEKGKREKGAEGKGGGGLVTLQIGLMFFMFLSHKKNN
jgi:hypothetical protein